MSGDEYVGVTARLQSCRPKAVLLQNDCGGGWIPRSCIHGGDDVTLDAVAIGDEITLRIFEWKAQQEGLV